MESDRNHHRSLRAVFGLSTAVFFLAMVLGLIQSLRSSHRLPPLNSHYTPEINLLIENENYEAVIPHLERAISIDLDNTEQNRNLLAEICLRSGQSAVDASEFRRAIAHYEKACAANPESTDAQNNLAWILATCRDESLRNGRRAMKLARRANQIKPNDPATLDTLAAAYAAAGDFQNAIKAQLEAIQLTRPSAQADMRKRLALYRSGRAYRAP